MVSVVDLKNRAIERLEGYRDDPRTLPALVHARYIKPTPLRTHKPKQVTVGGYAMRKHKPHQMHTQHRGSCVLVLQWLVMRLDLLTRQCVFVNPTRNIRRTIYIPEVARHTGLCERTVTRVMDSLTRARYVLRTVVGNTNQRYCYYLSDQLFRDLKLDVTLRSLVNRIQGLKAKVAKQVGKGSKPAPASKTEHPNNGPVSAAHKLFEKPYTPDKVAPTDEQRKIAASFLQQMRLRRPPG